MKKWRAALVLPQARRVLETQLRKLALDANCLELGLACRAVARPPERLSPPSSSADFGAAAFAHSCAAGEGWCGCRELHPDLLRGGEPFCC